MKFPERERRHHSDVFPGMTFFFTDPWIENKRTGEQFADARGEFNVAVPWTVISKELVERYDGNDRWCYLFLGPGPTVTWHIGSLGWIRRVADPAHDARMKSFEEIVSAG